MANLPLQLWSQSDWTIFLGSEGPTVRDIIRCLGLSHTNRRGVLKISEPETQALAEEVQKLSQALPTHTDALIESASDPNALDEALDTLLSTHGPAIWGANADRKRLLVTAIASDMSYPKELFLGIHVDYSM